MHKGVKFWEIEVKGLARNFFSALWFRGSFIILADGCSFGMKIRRRIASHRTSELQHFSPPMSQDRNLQSKYNTALAEEQIIGFRRDTANLE